MSHKEESSTASTSTFYDALSADYHLVYEDWEQSIARQAKAIHRLIEQYAPAASKTLLDCTCGIGTQAIGLRKLGYQVTASDISSSAVQRAKREAEQREVNIDFTVCDLLELGDRIAGTFDIVISCDNSLPHLSNEQQLLQALTHIKSKVHQGGIFIGSIRDYDQALADKQKTTDIIKRAVAGLDSITFQLWDWYPDETYVVRHFTLLGKDNEFETKVRTVRYRAYRRAELSQLLTAAGFRQVHWLMPNESKYFQPVFIGTT